MNGTATPPDDQAPPPPPPPLSDPPPAAAQTRPIFGGVCALLGDRLGVDAIWFRIGFILAALADGLGLVIYAALWLMLIAGRTQRSVALGVLGALVLLFGLPLVVGGLMLDGPLVVLFLLSGLAVALWQPRREASDLPPPPPGSGSTFADGTVPPGASIPSATPAEQHHPEQREPSVLGSITMGSAMVVAAVGALIDQANGGRLHPEQWLGAAAVVLGIGLLVGTVRGHARWLIVPALGVVAVGALGGQMARLGIGLENLAGDRWVGVYNDTEPLIDERIGLGDIQISIDDMPPQPVWVNARVAFGDIRITARDQVAVDLIRDGGDPRRIGRPDGPADVTVDARVGHGNIDVTTYAGNDEPLVDPDLEESLGRLRFVTNGVHMTDDGWFVLGDAEVVIDDQGKVVHGAITDEDDGVLSFYSEMGGDFRLLPRGLLVTPWDEVVDLQAIRAELIETPATSTTVTVPGPPEGAQP